MKTEDTIFANVIRIRNYIIENTNNEYIYFSQHFPYFKTAPNGWKNSVRHNLSLNKCFEKIEKPSTNGSQRKGMYFINCVALNKCIEFYI